MLLLVTGKVKNCCLCVLEGKYLCEDEKQGEKRCLRERKRKESTIRWKECICAWKKVCGVWQYISLYFCGEPQGGDFSLSVWINCQKSKERWRGECAKMLRRAWRWLYPPHLLSLSFSLSFSLSLSPITGVKLQKKRPHSSQPTLQIEHSPVKMS